jgi:hypothetical protein
MSRWLWALLAGVVLVAIAAFFWTASNQTKITPPPSFVRPNACRPHDGAQPHCAGSRALTCAPSRAGGSSPTRSDSGARS